MGQQRLETLRDLFGFCLIAGLGLALTTSVVSCGGDSGSTGADSSVETLWSDALQADASDLEPELAAETVETVSPWLPSAPVVAVPWLSADEAPGSEGICFDGEGRMLVTLNSGALLRVEADGSIETLATIEAVEGENSAGLAGVIWHPAWGIVVAQFTGGRLLQVTDSGEVSLLAEDIGGGPNAFVADPEGRLLLSLSEAKQVLRLSLDPPGGDLHVDLLAEGITYANGMAWSQDGETLYVAQTLPGGAIWQVPMQGEPPYAPSLLSEDALLTSADGLVMSPEGALLAASFALGRIVVYDLEAGAPHILSEEPKDLLAGVASLAFGTGQGFDRRCLYSTNLLKGGVAKICL